MIKAAGLLTGILFACRLFAQSYSFIGYSTSEGLPQSQVTSIGQDKEGYLWVGTLSGLARFNGREFKSYSTENGLASNRITALAVIDNAVWLGHEGAVSKMVNGKAVYFRIPGRENAFPVTGIVSFQNSVVVSTNGSGIFYLKNDRFIPLPFPNEDANRCRDMKIVNDVLYIATRGGLYRTANLKNLSFMPLLGIKSLSGFTGRSGKIWISSYTEGLFRTRSRSFSRVDSIGVKTPDYNIKGCYEDSRGNLWLYSNFGVVRRTAAGDQLFLSELNGLPVSSVNCIFEDREGIIWMGSEGKGLLRFTGEQFVHYNSKNGFPSDLILSVSKSSAYGYLFGSYDHGLFSLRNGQYKTYGLEGAAIWSVYTDRSQNIWAATSTGLELVQNGKAKMITSEDEEGRFTVIKELNSGRAIAGGTNGIGWIQYQRYLPLHLSKENIKLIGTPRDFAEHESQIICASDNGLFLIDAKNAVVRQVPGIKDGATTLATDSHGQIWVGTENGLYIYRDSRFDVVALGQSNSTRFINFVIRIANEMYVGTNNGLYELDGSSLNPVLIRNFGINEGLINLESNINSAYFDGYFLWFGTADGLIRMDIAKSHQSHGVGALPILHVTDMLLNFQHFDHNRYAGGVNEDGIPTSLMLPHNKNNLLIDLDGILLADPERVFYQFRLEGDNENWSPMLSNPTIVLNNLKSGDYNLHLRAVAANGLTSPEIILPIYIAAPFYATWWFILLVAIFVFLIIRMFVRRQLRLERDRNYKENLENKSRLLSLEQQSLNASMNRHFIFNSLNSIQYFINTQDKLSANRYLTNFAKLIRKNLDSAAEGDNVVSLTQELERLQLYLGLEAMRFKDRFTYHIDTGGIDTDQIMVPAMLLQPFVENSIIHGILPDENKMGEILVKLSLTESQLVIELRDNGIGIDFSMKQKKGFNGDHRSQGMEITSKRINLLRKLWKKDYELIGPYQLADENHSIKGTCVLIKIPYELLDFD